MDVARASLETGGFVVIRHPKGDSLRTLAHSDMYMKICFCSTSVACFLDVDVLWGWAVPMIVASGITEKKSETFYYQLFRDSCEEL